MTPSALRKQISLFVPLEDWKAIRREAARRGIPMTELCRQWLTPGLRRLQCRHSADGALSVPDGPQRVRRTSASSARDVNGGPQD